MKSFVLMDILQNYFFNSSNNALSWGSHILFFLALGSLIVYYRLKIRKIEKKNKDLQTEMQQHAADLHSKELQLSKINSLQSNLLKDLWESKRRFKQMNDDKDKFFSIVSHDLKSPFNSLIGFSDMMLDDFENLSRQEIKDYTVSIHKSVRNVYGLLENLLEWSRIQTGRMEFFPVKLDVYSLIDEIFATLNGIALKKNIRLSNQVSKSIFAYADNNMIRSVLYNLISNAIKFTHVSGDVMVLAAETDHLIEIAVSDTGIGINREDTAKLFRIDINFTKCGTSNEKGTGLGLVLCKELIEKNGGRIHVESEPGKGSTFVFTLPKYYNKIEIEKTEHPEAQCLHQKDQTKQLS